MLPVTGMVPHLKEITFDVSDFYKHLFMSVNMIGAILFAPISGLISDKLGKRKIIIVIAILINGIILYLMSMQWSYALFLGLRFLEGCAHIAALNLLMTLAIDYSKESNSEKIIGFIGASISLGVAMGVPAGGLLKGAGSVFVNGSYLLLFLTLFALFFLKDLKRIEFINPIKEILKSLKRNSNLSIPYVFTFVDRLTVGFIVSTLTLYLATYLNLNPMQIGFVMAIFLIPFAILTFPAGIISKRYNKLKMMMLGSITYGVLLSSLAFFDGFGLYPIMLLCGVASAIMFAPSLILVNQLSGVKNKATAMSGFNSSGSIGFMLGPLLSGALITFLKYSFNTELAYQMTFIIFGLAEIICVLIFIPKLKQIKT